MVLFIYSLNLDYQVTIWSPAAHAASYRAGNVFVSSAFNFGIPKREYLAYLVVTKSSVLTNFLQVIK
jgi:hypothetical protein